MKAAAQAVPAGVEADPRDEGLLNRFRQAVAEDLRLLAFLHDREPDRDTLMSLRQTPLQQCLGLSLGSEVAGEALKLIERAVQALPEPLDDSTLDRLAGEHATVYLLYGYRASPTESVWFDDDSLERQEATFQVRDCYRRHRVAKPKDDTRPDDHLVLQLRFLSHLFAEESDDEDLQEAATFLDEHPLRWVGQFAGRIASRCQEPYFAGLALLTAAYLEELRDLLAEALGLPRPDPEEIEARMKPKREPLKPPAPYVPGSGPGW